ncbi:O-methyltransferase-domain-containing protein [Diplogelasinospora grovesii]|uniref:O-methyltransferase-domain-containing protein n=1 Tax=Diplogelasinospora grovesii TaxID=303347 RepID=A0AAN6S546_9PEZI|nr:O-methyltransferase-domain-containing protein [Diplogelasinospora grovesii]
MADHTNGVNGHSSHDSKNVQDILQTLNNIDVDLFTNDGDRIQAVVAAYALVSRLETPWEFVLRTCMGQPALGAALKVGKDLELYEKWQERGNVEMNFQQLSKMLPDCEPALLYRILRHLASNHVLQETSIGVFKPTALSMSFTNPVFGEWINHLYDATLPIFYKMPIYLAQNGYRNPVDPTNGGDMFHYYQAHPVEGASFDHVMGGVMANQARWVDIFPSKTLIDTAKGGDSPLVVDVGGNIGHDIDKFRETHPETAARLYLEDLPQVVARSKCPDTVNKLGYDFFTPQPIKGARAYYMHGVLHDWSDEPARKIPEMQRDALTPGYSTLLIHDHIAAEQLAHPHATAYDLTMMVMVAGGERTEADWRKLLSSTRYKVVKIWNSPLAIQGIIEAELDV